VAVLPWSLEMQGNKMFSVNCHHYMDFIYKYLPLYTGVGLLSQPGRPELSSLLINTNPLIRQEEK
jgi:hypothetical protein